MKLILRLLINAAALFVAANVVPGFKVGDLTSLALLALIFGVVNALVRPVVKLLACGVIVLTLGLFTFVINAGMLMLAGWLGKQFGLDVTIDGFGSAFVAALIVSAVSLVLSWILPDGDGRDERARDRDRD